MNVGLVDCGDWAGSGGVPEWILGSLPDGAWTETTLNSLSVSANLIPEFRMEILPAVFSVATLLTLLISRRMRKRQDRSTHQR